MARSQTTTRRPVRADSAPSAGAASSVLPAPVARFADLATRLHPGPIATVVLDTDAWMRRPWWMPIPLRIRMSHQLGTAFVHEIRIGRSALSFPFGLDAFVDDRGLMVVGRSVQTGPTFDQGARIAMWGEALIFPGAWLTRADVAWEAIDDRSARLVVPSAEGHLPIRVDFDASTGLPRRCVADRYKGNGPLTRWSGSWSDWRVSGDGVLAPYRMAVRWADEAHPWLTIRVAGLVADVPVEDTLGQARASLAIAGGQAP
jgi:hypothetical protein